MSNSTEARILALEQANKSRKVSHKVVGSLVKFSVTPSQVFTKYVAAASANVVLRVKFTANSVNSSGKAFVKLSALVSINPDFANLWPDATIWSLPQDGDGNVISNVRIATGAGDDMTFYIKIVATGATGGTFTQL